MLFIEKQNVSIPRLGLGTWQATGDSCINAVKHALATGYRHVDTAQAYDNEGDVGRALQDSDVARDDIFLTTKIWRDNVGKGTLEPSLDASLQKLKTDYVDLLLIHWPVDEVPLEETMEALQAVQKKGKTRLIGVSNFTTRHLQRCVEELNVPLAVNQVEYHPYLSQEPVLSFLRKHDMFLTAYSPLGRSKLCDDPTLQALADNYGKSVGQVILRWHLQQHNTVAIPKSTTPQHIEDNFNIFDFELDDNAMNAINQLQRKNQRLIDPDFAPQWDEPQSQAA